MSKPKTWLDKCPMKDGCMKCYTNGFESGMRQGKQTQYINTINLFNKLRNGRFQFNDEVKMVIDMLKDEGLLNTFKIFTKYLTNKEVRSRMMLISSTFRQYPDYFGYGVYSFSKTWLFCMIWWPFNKSLQLTPGILCGKVGLRSWRAGAAGPRSAGQLNSMLNRLSYRGFEKC